MKVFNQGDIDDIVAAIAAGVVMAVPTETVYGLAVRYDDMAAIERLRQIKDRTADSGKVFTLMLASADQIGNFALESDLSRRLATRYFPGELTLVLSKNPDFASPYFNQFDTVGVRVPDHPWLLRLLKKTGPLIVTSANLRGGVPAVTGNEVQASLPDIDAVVIGRAGGHAPSTVVRVDDGQIAILRQGDLTVL